MKTKLAITLVLTVACLFPIITGVSTAQQDDPNKASLDYTVYLPLISKPPCVRTPASVYIAVSDPIVKVGELVTVTGALFNECAYVGEPYYILYTEPEDILYPSKVMSFPLPSGVGIGMYQEITFTVQAVGTGVVGIRVGASYETYVPPNPYYWENVISSYSVIRVLP
jgi:hypothetical protein